MSDDFNHTHYPTARKQHRCGECSRTISPGERYSKTAAVWEGDFFTNVACLHCALARFIVDYQDDYYSESFYSGLAEWLGDNWFDGVWAARLKVGVDRDWQRFDGLGLMPLPSCPWPAAHLQQRIAAAVGTAVVGISYAASVAVSA